MLKYQPRSGARMQPGRQPWARAKWASSERPKESGNRAARALLAAQHRQRH